VRRREVIAGIASAASAGWPLAPRAQPGRKIYRLGVLEAIPAASNVANLEGLRRGLRKRGYVEGRNLVIRLLRCFVSTVPRFLRPTAGTGTCFVLARRNETANTRRCLADARRSNSQQGLTAFLSRKEEDSEPRVG